MAAGSDASAQRQDVYAVVRAVPRGRVTTYGAIAAALGMKSGARMVGWALNQANALALDVPAHRVVNRNGQLTGKAHFPTPEAMQERLEAEGVVVENDKVADFERLFWDPASLDEQSGQLNAS